ncbi:MAG TPA: HD domain-containing protein [Candidatus Polarisedimenticolaceae bacterium]|nr:HD domain-containing protein [Candidatus Polarisedimenticolaceae bacterium]
MSRPALDEARLVRRLSARLSADTVLGTLAEAARRTRAELCLVGGYVRDAALGLPPGDLDLVGGRRVRALLGEIRERFDTAGFRFRRRGVTTWRFCLDGRPVDLVDASRRGIEHDLFRRELTANAVAFDLVDRRLVDPARGLDDLGRRLLRGPRSDAFADDPVRSLRLCRFVACMPGFSVSPRTTAEARRVALSLRRSPAERLRPELDKLLAGADPARGLQMMRGLGLLAVVLPELSPLERCVAGRGRPDVWAHTLATLSVAAGPRRLPGLARVRQPEQRAVLRWSLLLHDVAKPETLAFTTDGRPTFHGHEELGRRRGAALMRRLRVPETRRRRVERLVLNHLRPGHLADGGASPRALARLARAMGDDLPLLVAHAACDARASGGPGQPARWRRLAAVLTALLGAYDRRPAEPTTALVDGRDVMRVAGIAPGPRVGRLLERVRRRQRAGLLRTRDQALAFLRRATRPGRRR